MITITKFFLNDQEYYGKGFFTLFDIITYFGYNASLLVIEYNDLICDKKNWRQIGIQNEDKIEIVTIVGGG
uniref:Thiamine biosynthesis protein n=1 Tax=Coscinodiscus granii TaxID=265552 RepID=A0A8A6KTK2_9STRA|nr:Thiamine biosynthesis protein [Coscinodiscus granii]QTI82911.1 Thiamine biosynthesis protein [Coscinodiscus granii]